MKIFATVLQLLGLSGLAVAAGLVFGVSGVVAGASVAALYVGVAMEH